VELGSTPAGYTTLVYLVESNITKSSQKAPVLGASSEIAQLLPPPGDQGELMQTHASWPQGYIHEFSRPRLRTPTDQVYYSGERRISPDAVRHGVEDSPWPSSRHHLRPSARLVTRHLLSRDPSTAFESRASESTRWALDQRQGAGTAPCFPTSQRCVSQLQWPLCPPLQACKCSLGRRTRPTLDGFRNGLPLVTGEQWLPFER
jgi:hypothetical protein